MRKPKNVEEAFLRAIRETPDDDVPRLVYADWLTDHGNELGRARAELIRVQCELARLTADDPGRAALAERESALLSAHGLDWTDLAFAEWLGHSKRACKNREGHEFCKLVRQGIRTRCDHDRLPDGILSRRKLAEKLNRLRSRMEEEFGYFPDTCDVPIFDRAEFRRGFVESVVVQDWALDLFAEALPELTVLRELEIDNDALTDGGGDASLKRLVEVMDRLSLESLNCGSSIDSLEPVRLLTSPPAASRLSKLHLWYDAEENGDRFVAILAASPHLTGLRDLYVEHTETFTDAAFLAVLDSPTLAGLTSCWLRPNEDMPLSEAVVKRFAARFGPQVEKDCRSST